VKAELPDITGLRAIKRLRFRRPVFPAQQVSVTVKRDQQRVTFEVSSAANVVASGQLVVD
jgi:3-hydroxymyristoyl/3-hydroxydecanoyl-(acyl carrier protein) dehydratase